jgi:hypothetical protein
VAAEQQAGGQGRVGGAGGKVSWVSWLWGTSRGSKGRH